MTVRWASLCIWIAPKSLLLEELCSRPRVQGSVHIAPGNPPERLHAWCSFRCWGSLSPVSFMSVWKVLHLTCMYIPGSPQFLSVLGVNPKDCQETAALLGSTKVASYRIGCGGSRNVQIVLLTTCFDLSRLPSPSMFSFSDFSESFLHIVIWGICRRLAALNEANRKALVFSLQCLDSSSGSGLSCSLKPGLELWPLLVSEFPFEMRSHQGCTSHRVLCLFWWCVISNSKLIDLVFS